MLDALNREDRLQLMRFVCSFAWADLEIADAERDFIVKLVVRLGLDDEEQEQVANWLEVPPRADDLDHAIELVNQTGYGLTSGLESLDPREVSYWKERIKAGNLYINRGTTGAVVLRQPFGGMAKSAVGPGLKAGGPNYVASLADFRDTDAPLASGSLRIGFSGHLDDSTDCRQYKTTRSIGILFDGFASTKIPLKLISVMIKIPSTPRIVASQRNSVLGFFLLSLSTGRYSLRNSTMA